MPPSVSTISNIIQLKIIIVGEVIIKRWASVWYNSVIRGDINRVE